MANKYGITSYIIIIAFVLINLLGCTEVESACFLLFWDRQEKVIQLDQDKMPESEGEPEYVIFYDHDQKAYIETEVVWMPDEKETENLT